MTTKETPFRKQAAQQAAKTRAANARKKVTATPKDVIKVEAKQDGRVLRGNATKAKILAEARRLIDETGRVPSIESIAAGASVAVRTVYHSFKNAEDVLRHALALSPSRKLVVTYEPYPKEKKS